MARVTVEQKALVDPRFVILGSHLAPLTHGARETVETAYGLYQMIRVWNYCTERGLLAVPARDLDALHDGLADAMVDAQLGELVNGSKMRLVRIKGGDGVLDWLEKKRASGREHGVKGAEHGTKGGRPRKKTKPSDPVINKPSDPVTENGVRGLQNNPPPAPAPAPVPAPAPALKYPPTPQVENNPTPGINTAGTPAELADLWLFRNRRPGRKDRNELTELFSAWVADGISVETIRIEMLAGSTAEPFWELEKRVKPKEMKNGINASRDVGQTHRVRVSAEKAEQYRKKTIRVDSSAPSSDLKKS